MESKNYRCPDLPEVQNGPVGYPEGPLMEQEGEAILAEALPEEWAWANFLLDAKFSYGLNLDLAYFLVYAQRTSISDAARILNVSRRTLMEGVLKSNPAFMHEITKGLGRLEGGRQRRIILSDGSRKWQEKIKMLARIRRGGDRCQELQKLAEPVRRGALKDYQGREKQYTKWITDARKNYIYLVQDKKSPRALLEQAARHAQKWGRTPEEVKKSIVDGSIEARL